MGAVVHSRARTSSRSEPALPRVLRHIEIGAWVLTIAGAVAGMISVYTHFGAQAGEPANVLSLAVALAVIPYVLARAIASLRRSLH